MDAKDYPEKPTIIGQVPCFQEGDDRTMCCTGFADVWAWKSPTDGRPLSKIVPREPEVKP